MEHCVLSMESGGKELLRWKPGRDRQDKMKTETWISTNLRKS